jgi:hypothetical protein
VCTGRVRVYTLRPPYAYSGRTRTEAGGRAARRARFGEVCGLLSCLWLAEERVDEQVVPRLVLSRRRRVAAAVGASEHLQGVGLAAAGHHGCRQKRLGGRRVRRRRGAAGGSAAHGHVVVVLALVGGDHGAVVVRRALHVLPHGAPRRRALVVAPRVRVPLHHLLPVLAPPEPIVQDVDVAQRLHHQPGLADGLAAGAAGAALVLAILLPEENQ